MDELFGLKMGADDFIRKPFSPRLLVETRQGPVAPGHCPGTAPRRGKPAATFWNAANCAWTRSGIPAPGKTSR